jgi:hypothetical protein
MLRSSRLSPKICDSQRRSRVRRVAHSHAPAHNFAAYTGIFLLNEFAEPAQAASRVTIA